MSGFRNSSYDSVVAPLLSPNTFIAKLYDQIQKTPLNRKMDYKQLKKYYWSLDNNLSIDEKCKNFLIKWCKIQNEFMFNSMDISICNRDYLKIFKYLSRRDSPYNIDTLVNDVLKRILDLDNIDKFEYFELLNNIFDITSRKFGVHSTNHLLYSWIFVNNITYTGNRFTHMYFTSGTSLRLLKKYKWIESNNCDIDLRLINNKLREIHSERIKDSYCFSYMLPNEISQVVYSFNYSFKDLNINDLSFYMHEMYKLSDRSWIDYTCKYV